MRIERSGQKRCLQGPAVMGWQPVGGKPFGFDGERRIGRTGHYERLSAWRRISKGQGRKTTTTSRRVPRRTSASRDRRNGFGWTRLNRRSEGVGVMRNVKR